MNMLRGDTLEALLKEVRQSLKKGNEPITLSAAQARLLADELSRLLQSTDRLRRQNKRVRRKLQAATGEVVGEPDADGRLAGDADDEGSEDDGVVEGADDEGPSQR